MYLLFISIVNNCLHHKGVVNTFHVNWNDGQITSNGEGNTNLLESCKFFSRKRTTV